MSFDLPIAWLVVFGVTAVCVLAYLRGRPGVTLGVLFAAASFSGLTAPTPVASVRMEQVALVAVLGLMLFREPRAITAWLRAVPIFSFFGALYLGSNVISSALVASEPGESLKIAGWLGLSMVGMGVAGVLVRSAQNDLRLSEWIVGAAAIQVTVGLAAVS